jgi:type II secretory pathway pseudopilin PulG
VENIVVIVLMTALMAFMVFAIAGYVDKARDERYIFAARDYSIATRAVLSESTARSSFVLPPSRIDAESGDSSTRSWGLSQLSEYVAGDGHLFCERAEELMGVEPSPPEGAGSWDLWLIGPSTATSFWDADAYLYMVRPAADDSSTTDSVIYVTFRMERVNATDAGGFLAGFWQQARYNPDAGFRVYRFAR